MTAEYICCSGYEHMEFNLPHNIYEACPESKDTKFLNMYNNFNLQKRHCEWTACT
jgi:hypothetical protein